MTELAFSSVVVNDLTNLLLGTKLGEGDTRQAFVFLPDTSLVAKVENGVFTRDNAVEWEVWQYAKDNPLGRWLAPCVTISENNKVLIQKRTQPIPVARLPKLVPILLVDTKQDNWGLVERGGRLFPVCHDYANNRVLELGIKNTEMVVPSWHSPEYKGWLK